MVRVLVFADVEQSGEKQYRWVVDDPDHRKVCCQLHLSRLGQVSVGAEHPVGTLTRQELARADRYLVRHARRQFIESREFLRSTLAGYLGCKPIDVAIKEDERGKLHLDPEVHGRTLHFNLSHAGQHVLIGVSADADIGVDIEEAKALPDEAELASAVMTAAERHCYLALDPVARRAMFFRSWTVKEAFVKATGEGFNFPPTRIQVDYAIEGNVPLGSASMHDGKHYYAACFVPSPEVVAAVVLGIRKR